MEQDLITAVASKCTLASAWLATSSLEAKSFLKNAGLFFFFLKGLTLAWPV